MKLYKGVIEDNNNPNKNGTVRVRIDGIHTENNENSKEKFNYISTSELPWSNIIQNINFTGTGIGLSEIPNNGTWVYLILENDDVNKPIIIGAINAISTNSSIGVYSNGIGFCDPNENFPIEDRLNESDINRLARVENLDKTIHQTIIDNKDKQLNITDSISGADVSQTEPDSLNNNSIYPDVSIHETKSGHIIELDDTATNERIRVYHKTGSYIEIRPDGSFIQKSVGAENHYIHIGDINEHIKGSIKTYIETNIDEIINGYVKRNIKGNLNEHFNSNVDREINGKLTELVNGDVSANYKSNQTENIGQKRTTKITATDKTTVNSSSDELVSGIMTKKGAMIYLN